MNCQAARKRVPAAMRLRWRLTMTYKERRDALILMKIEQIVRPSLALRAEALAEIAQAPLGLSRPEQGLDFSNTRAL